MPSSSKRRGAVEKRLQSKPLLKTTVSMPGVLVVDDANGKTKLGEDFEASEYDSMSNNGSCSGESSEDQGVKEKVPIPGLEASLDKQEKIRLKNEKKHQRQRERRAKELKERCEGYLVSNKLERLAQQLVSMGFPSDKATMALILNDGHVEQSISFLLEDGVAPNDVKKAGDSSVKIDISEELKILANLETKFKFNRQDIERAVVACEGDIDKACKWLQEHQPRPEAESVSKQGTPSSTSVSASAQRRAELLQLQQQHPGFWVQHQPLPMVPPRPAAAAAIAPRTGPWQRASPAAHGQGVVPFVAAARPDLVHHRTLPEFGLQRQFPPDPRSYHYPVGGAISKRLEDMLLLNPDHFKPPGLQQQQQQQQQVAFRGHLQPPAAAAFQPMWGSSISQQQVDAGASGFDDWNAKAFRSIDYRAIDWSMGPSRPLTSMSHTATGTAAPEQQQQQQRSSQHQQAVDAVGYNELPDSLSLEWATPFAGKELFQHQAVPSL